MSCDAYLYSKKAKIVFTCYGCDKELGVAEIKVSDLKAHEHHWAMCNNTPTVRVRVDVVEGDFEFK